MSGLSQPGEAARYFMDMGAKACIFKMGAKARIRARPTRSSARLPSR